MKELLKTIIEKLDELISLFKDGPINVTGSSECPVTTVEYTPHPHTDVIKESFVNYLDTRAVMHDFTLHDPSDHADDKPEHMQPDEFLQFSLNQGVSIDAGGENQPWPQRMDDGGTRAIKIVAGVIVDGPDELLDGIAKARAASSRHGGGFILHYINGCVWMGNKMLYRFFRDGKWSDLNFSTDCVPTPETQVYANRNDADTALYNILIGGKSQLEYGAIRLCERGYIYAVDTYHNPPALLRRQTGFTKFEMFDPYTNSWGLV